jgi:hypothetical protein
MTVRLAVGAGLGLAAGFVALAAWQGGTVAKIVERLACNAGALDPAEQKRAEALRARLRAATREVRELENGYAFRIDPSVELGELAEFMTYERRCCSFFAFGLEVAPEGGPVWLRLTGRDGAKEVLKAAMGL